MPSIDLGRYLKYIGHADEVRPTLEVLRDVAYRHATTIPFENLDPFLGLPVSLDITEVEHKLIVERRGGYCFEQNLLLWEALRAIGFEAFGLAARVVWRRPVIDTPPRSHMLLRVPVGGRDYLVDVGFGGLTLTGALEFTPNTEQATAHEPFRMLHADGAWSVQAKVNDDWRTLYHFDLQVQHPVDYSVVNYFTSTHHNSPFVNSLFAARAKPGLRYALRDREFNVYGCDAAAQTRRLSNHEILDVLENEMGINVPRSPTLFARLESLP